MRQFIDLAEKRRSKSGSVAEENRSQPQHYNQALDLEEVKVGAEADYMSDVIKQRQEELNNVEKLMSDINSIAKQINTNIED